MLFNEKLDLKLIKLVRDNPVLYDHNNAQYMDFNAREVVWQKIGDELKRPAMDCKARWINIRDINRRILRKTLKNPGTRTRLYKYDGELSFMRPFYRDIQIQNADFEWDDNSNTQGDCEAEDVADDSDDSCDEKPIKVLKAKKSSSSFKKKKKRHYEDEEKPAMSASTAEVPLPSEFDPSDPVDAFLLSIGATLKTFSPYHLNLAKSKIFAVVQEHDLQQIVQKQNHETQPMEVKLSAPDDNMYKNG